MQLGGPGGNGASSEHFISGLFLSTPSIRTTDEGTDVTITSAPTFFRSMVRILDQ